MGINLEDALASHEPQFKAEPYYNSPGDCIVHFLKEEPYHAEWVDGFVTFYRSKVNGSVVGYKIKGINALTEQLSKWIEPFEAQIHGSHRVKTNENGELVSIEIQLLFNFLLVQLEADNEKRASMFELGEKLKGIFLDLPADKAA